MQSDVQRCSVQFARELQQFMRSAEVECKLRRAATSETFSDQVNQASDPSNLFRGQFWRLPLFRPTQSRIQPFSEANFVPATFCPPGLSRFIFTSNARVHKVNQGQLGEQLQLWSPEFSPGALCLFNQGCCTTLCLNQHHSAFSTVTQRSRYKVLWNTT